MATKKRTERLFDLRRRFESGAKLIVDRICHDYDIDRRTVNRDLTALANLGLGFQTEVAGDGRKVWSVSIRHRKINVSYNLTDLTALLMGRRLFDFLKGTLLEESLDKIYDSIEMALESKKNYLGAQNLADKVYLISEAPKQLAQAHVDCLDDCLTALLGEKLLDITYVNVKGERHKHRVEPLTLMAFRRGLYLLARYQGTETIRIFALERIKEAEWIKGTGFKYPKDFDPKTYFKDALFIRPGKPSKVVLLFTKSTEPFIRIRKFHDSQKTKKKRDGSIEVALSVPLEDELLYWILSFGANVVVKEPAELRQWVKGELENTIRQYGGG